MSTSDSRCTRSFPSRKFQLLFWLLLLAIGSGQRVFAQFSATLTGTVEDTSGATIPGATITLTSAGTQVVKTATSSDTGFYTFSELAPGVYSVTVTAKNFKPQTYSAVALAAERARSLDVKLELGGSTQTVTVSANDTPLLQTSDANVSGILDSEQIQRIPTSGGDPYELLRTAPGISGDSARSGGGQAVFLPNGGGPGQSNSGIFQTENQVQISAAGQRTSDNNFLLDGVSINSLGYGGAAVLTPNEEAVAQINVTSTSFDAADGRNSGAQIKIVSKSGSNDIHGSAFFEYDEPGLNAYNKYGGPIPGELPVRVQNKQRYYAASLGGPIVKDKLFFFLSYEGYTSLNDSYPFQFVETPQFRSLVATDRPGSIATAIVNGPGSTPRIRAILPVTCTTPYNVGSNTSTPPTCQEVGGGLDIGSPTGATGTYLSNGNLGGGLDGIPDVNYAQLVLPSRSRGNQYNARGDWYATPHDQVSGSFFVTHLDNNGPSSTADSRPNDDVPFKPLNLAVTAIYIHTFSPSLINEFRANGTRFADNGVRDAAGQVNYGIPYINIQGYGFDALNDIQYGVDQASTQPAIFAQNQYEVRDTVTKTIGSHTINVGFEYRLEQDNNNLAGDSRPVYAFSGLWNFVNDSAVYEGIFGNPLTGGVPNTQRYLRDHYIAGFIQHDWKALPNLTFNAGLRWEYFEPLYNKGSEVNLPVLGPAGAELLDASLVPHNHFYNAENHDFSPKVAFAFTPPGQDDKLVVRGGFAIAYNRINDALFNNAVEDGPGFFNYGLCCGPGSGVQYTLGTSSSPFSYPKNPALITAINSKGLPANGDAIEVYGALPVTHTPYSYLYSLEVQRQFPGQIVTTLGYQGSTGRHYSRLVQEGFIYSTSGPNGETDPFGSGAYIGQNDSNQYYNGLNAHFSKRFTQGITLDATYTWSKSMDQVSNGDEANANANQTYPEDNRTELGQSDYDLRHHVTATGLWDIPKVHINNKLASAAVNGWQLNGIYTYHTGFPFTPVTYQLFGIPTVPTAQTPGPVRPTAYYGGALSGCSNSLFTGTGLFPGNITNTGTYPATSKYFDIVPTKNAAGNALGSAPGIGRNSFRGPCYQDADMSFAKQFELETMGHDMKLRFQANAYNVFNILNLTPFTNGNGNPGAQVESSTFGRAQEADSGRVIEFTARLQF